VYVLIATGTIVSSVLICLIVLTKRKRSLMAEELAAQGYSSKVRDEDEARRGVVVAASPYQDAEQEYISKISSICTYSHSYVILPSSSAASTLIMQAINNTINTLLFCA
jgi:hypothetical protein